MNSYKLVSGVARNREHPTTFTIPPLKDRKAVKRGDYVRILFEPVAVDPSTILHGERMWVLVSESDRNSFSGTLANTPVTDMGIKYGDLVNFKSWHIISILHKDK